MREKACGTDIAAGGERRPLQRGKGIERRRGDDGAVAGADEGLSGFRTGSPNET